MKPAVINAIAVITALLSCSSPPPERMVSMDGYDLHLKDLGSGRPVVILECALGADLSYFDSLQKEISGFTRVISYDRAGLGESTPDTGTQSINGMVIDLKNMLDKEKIKPPYILAGHSMGGFIIRLFSYMYPEDVAGLVFIDASHEDYIDLMKKIRTKEEWSRFDSLRNSSLLQLPENIKKEWHIYMDSREIMRNIKMPENIPIRVITSVKYGEQEKALLMLPQDKKNWQELHAGWIRGKDNAEQIVTDKSGHFVHLEEPSLVVDAIKEVYLEVKNK